MELLTKYYHTVCRTASWNRITQYVNPERDANYYFFSWVKILGGNGEEGVKCVFRVDYEDGKLKDFRR